MEIQTSKKIQRYSDEDLHKEYGEPWKSPKGIDDFLALIYFWFYHDDEDFESVGVWGFENKLHALKHLYENLMESEDYINPQMFDQMKNEFINAINSIEELKADYDVDLSFASYDNGGNGLIIICHGYWDDVVKDIAGYIKDVFEHEYAHLTGKNLHHAHHNHSLEDMEEYLRGLKEEMDACGRIIAAKDLHSQDFVEYFTKMCDSFDARMNP